MVLDLRYVPCECSVYWMFCIYLVFVVVAFFLKHQFTINEYFLSFAIANFLKLRLSFAYRCCYS